MGKRCSKNNVDHDGIPPRLKEEQHRTARFCPAQQTVRSCLQRCFASDQQRWPKSGGLCDDVQYQHRETIPWQDELNVQNKFANRLVRTSGTKHLIRHHGDACMGDTKASNPCHL